MLPDDLRDGAGLRAVVVRRLLERPQDLSRVLDELLARNGRAEVASVVTRAKLEAEIARMHGEVTDLHRRLREARREIAARTARERRLKRELGALRASPGVRLSRALAAPLNFARKYRRSHGPGRSGAVDSGERSAQRSTADDDLHAAVRRLWRDEGAIRRPQALLGDTPPAAGTPLAPLAAQIHSAGQVLDSGWPVPPRSRGVAYVPDRQRVMYCVHSTPAFDSNGYAVRTRGIAEGLREQGIDVVVVARPGYPWGKPGANVPVRERLVRAFGGVDYVHNPGSPDRDRTLAQYLDEAADMYVREARILRPSLIHAASNAHVALPALVAARRLGVPFVYEVRGLWEITAASTRPGWAESDRYRLDVQLETLVTTEADAVLAITSQVADVLVTRGLDRSRIGVLPNGAFRPGGDGALEASPVGALPKEKLVIGFAGSLAAYEGLDVLVEAAGLLRERRTDFEVVIAGSGEVEHQLREQVAGLELDEVVRVIGRVPHEQMPALLSQFDVVACPRRSVPITELVSPLKPLEAFAAGIPVVLSDVAPHRNLAGSGDAPTALLARADDPRALAAGLEELLDSPERRASLAENARQWVRSERTWGVLCSVAVEAYGAARAHHRSATTPGRRLGELRVGLAAEHTIRSTVELAVKAIPVSVGEPPSEDLDLVLVASSEASDPPTAAEPRGPGDLHEIVSAYSGAVPLVYWDLNAVPGNEMRPEILGSVDVVLTVEADHVPGIRLNSPDGLSTVACLPHFVEPRLDNPVRGPVATTVSPDLAAFAHDQKPAGVVLSGRHVVDAGSASDSPSRYPLQLLRLAARGAVVLSTGSRAVRESLGGAVVETDDPLIRDVLDDWWTEDPEARRSEAWFQIRSLLRAHTATSSLAILARTAGLAVECEVLPSYALLVDDLSPGVAVKIAQQSVVASTVHVAQGASAEATEILESAGVTVRDRSALGAAAASEPWIGRWVGSVGRTYYEDLLYASQWVECDRVEPVPAELAPDPACLAWLGPTGHGGPMGLVASRLARGADGFAEAGGRAKVTLCVVLAPEVRL